MLLFDYIFFIDLGLNGLTLLFYSLFIALGLTTPSVLFTTFAVLNLLAVYV